MFVLFVCLYCVDCSVVGQSCSGDVTLCNTHGQYCDTQNAEGLGANKCRKVPIGFFNIPGSGESTPCDTGSTTSDTGATGVSSLPACDLCEINYERTETGNTNTICVACSDWEVKETTGNYDCVSKPSGQPTGQPSGQPSAQPSMRPSGQPSSQPTGQPTSQPSMQPSRQPTSQPSMQPSGHPSGQPSSQPSGQPSGQPTGQPSRQPSGQPTSNPTSTYEPTPGFAGEIAYEKLHDELKKVLVLDLDILQVSFINAFTSMPLSIYFIGSCTMLFFIFGIIGNRLDYVYNNSLDILRNKMKPTVAPEPPPEFVLSAASLDTKKDMRRKSIKKALKIDIAKEVEHRNATKLHAEAMTAFLQEQGKTINTTTYFSKIVDALFPPVFRANTYTKWQRCMQELWYHHHFFSMFYIANIQIPCITKQRIDKTNTNRVLHRTRPKSRYKMTPGMRSLQYITYINFMSLFLAIILRGWKIDVFLDPNPMNFQVCMLVLLFCASVSTIITSLLDLIFDELLIGQWELRPGSRKKITEWYGKHRVVADDWMVVDPNSPKILMKSIENREKKIKSSLELADSIKNKWCKPVQWYIDYFQFKYEYVLPDVIFYLYEDAYNLQLSISDQLFDLSVHVMEGRSHDLRLKASHTTLQVLAGTSGNESAVTHDENVGGTWSISTEMSDLISKLMLQRTLISDMDDLMHFDNLWGIHIGSSWTPITTKTPESTHETISAESRALMDDIQVSSSHVQNDVVSKYRRNLEELDHSNYETVDGPNHECGCCLCCSTSYKTGVEGNNIAKDHKGSEATQSILLDFLQNSSKQGHEMLDDIAASMASYDDPTKGEEFVGFQLLNDFVIDMLGRELPQADIYRSYMKQEYNRKRCLLSAIFKSVIVFMIIIFNIFAIIMCVVITSHEKDEAWQLTWLLLSISSLFMEIFVLETITTFIINFAIPDFYSSHIDNVKTTVQSLVVHLLSSEEEMRDLRNEFGEDEAMEFLIDGYTQPGLSAPEFLFPSIRVARQMLFLPEAALISLYRSIYPSEMFVQRVAKQVMPVAPSSCAGLIQIACALFRRGATYIGSNLGDLLSGALPTKIILSLGSFNFIIQRLFMRILCISTMVTILSLIYFLNGLFGVKDATIYLCITLGAVYVVSCFLHWMHSQKLANESAIRLKERVARQNKVDPMLTPMQHIFKNERDGGGDETMDFGSGSMENMPELDEPKASKKKKEKKSKAKKVEPEPETSSDSSSQVKTSSDEESDVDIEQLAMLKEISNMLIDAEKEHHKAVVEHDERLHKQRMQRAKHAAIEARALDPTDTMHSVPLRELGPDDRLNLGKADHYEDEDPLPENEWQEEQARRRRESGRSGRKSFKGAANSVRASMRMSGGRRATERSKGSGSPNTENKGPFDSNRRQSSRKSMRDGKKNDSHIVNDNTYSPGGDPLGGTIVEKTKKQPIRSVKLTDEEQTKQDSIDRVASAKKVQEKRQELFNTPRPDPKNVKPKTETSLGGPTNWAVRFKDEISQEEEPLDNTKPLEDFNLKAVDSYIHKQYNKHAEALGPDFELDAVKFGQDEDARIEAEERKKREEEERKRREEEDRKKREEEEARLAEEERVRAEAAAARKKLAEEAELRGEELKLQDIEENDSTTLKLTGYHNAMIIRPKQAVGLEGTNDYEKQLLSDMKIKQLHREESVTEQTNHIKDLIREEKELNANKAKFGIGVIKAQKHIVQPGLLGNISSPSISRKVMTHNVRSDLTPREFPQGEVLDPYAPLPARKRGPDGNFTDIITSTDKPALDMHKKVLPNGMDSSTPTATAWSDDMDIGGNRSKLAYTPPDATRDRVLTPEYDESRDFRTDEEREADNRARRKKDREEQGGRGTGHRRIINRDSDGERSPERFNRDDLYIDDYDGDYDTPGGHQFKRGSNSFNRSELSLHERDSRFAPPVNVKMGVPKPHPNYTKDIDPYISEEEEELSDADDSSPIRARRHLMKYKAQTTKKEIPNKKKR